MVDFKDPTQVLKYAKEKLGDVITCTRMTGGGVNYVYRLKYADKSIVLKHYAAHLSSDTEFEYSQERYLVEKKVLSTFGKFNKKQVKVPKLLYFDDANYVVVMEDGGEKIVCLEDYFLNKNDHLEWDNLASSIVEFFANLHLFDANSVSDVFLNPLAIKTNHYFHDNMLAEKLKSLEPFKNDKVPEIKSRKTLVMGDFWPNSICLNFESRTIWVVDWETARFGNGLDDIAQCSGNLWLMEQKPELFNTSRIQQFTSEMVSEYILKTGAVVTRENRIRTLIYIVYLARYPHWGFADPDLIINKVVLDFNNLLK